MKTIKYKIVAGENEGEAMLIDKAILCDSNAVLAVNLPIVQSEAYNGEYEIYDDGIEEVIEPTQLDIIEAQVTYTAMMTGTLLEE